MLSKDFLFHLEQLFSSKVRSYNAVSGGDISSAYVLKIEKQHYFIKTNSAPNALSMFKAEEASLKAINNTNTIKTPEVHFCNSYNSEAYIIMDFIESKNPTSNDLTLLGKQLAKLHSNTNESFGFYTDNFIGSLKQSNKEHISWNDFYIEQRLQPQLELAFSKGLLMKNELPSHINLKEQCASIFDNVKPSLLHGDLWSGNYLISKNGEPFLIDPATYYGHSEIDIAMSKLFGGFYISFYDSYHKIIPADTFTNNRIELYQLYYLLVHLNIFGSSYYPSVKHILSKYI